MLRRMNDIPTPADYVAVEIAGKATGIPARTLRYWISAGKLAAIAGKGSPKNNFPVWRARLARGMVSRYTGASCGRS